MLEYWSDANNVFQFVRIEDIAYDKRPGMENVVYLVDSGRGLTPTSTLDTPFRSTNGRVWKMVLDPADPTVVTSLTVFVEGDDNPVKTLNEVHQPDNIESTANGLLLTEDPGSSQQFPVGSTDPNATAARLWFVPFAGAPEVVVTVDQSAHGGSTDVDGRAVGNLGAWESSGIVDASSAFGSARFDHSAGAHPVGRKAPGDDNNGDGAPTSPTSARAVNSLSCESLGRNAGVELGMPGPAASHARSSRRRHERGHERTGRGVMRGGQSAAGLALAVAVSMATVSAVATTAAGSGARLPALEFVGQSIFPTGTDFEGTQVGGLSSITFDEGRGVFYAISDDQSQFAPARYYTLRVDLDDGRLDDGDVEFLDVTTLLAPDGQPYPLSGLDPEGLTLTKSGELIVTSEGIPGRGIAPWVRRYGLDGTFLGDLPVPSAFTDLSATHGVRPNLAFEAAAVAPDGRHLFVGMEGALLEDGPAANLTGGSPARILRYNLITRRLERQFVYQTDPVAEPPVPPSQFSVNGLVECRRSTTSSWSRWSARSRWAHLEQATRSSSTRSRSPVRRTSTAPTASPACSATSDSSKSHSCSTCVRSASRSTTSRAWPSARTCPTADAP